MKVIFNGCSGILVIAEWQSLQDLSMALLNTNVSVASVWLTEKILPQPLEIIGRSPTVNLPAECHVLRVEAILSAHWWSIVTNHIIKCLNTHSHLFSSRLMVKWRKNQWLPSRQKEPALSCFGVWCYPLLLSPDYRKLKAQFERTDTPGVSQVDIMNDFNLPPYSWSIGYAF